jgi:Flp pilus assembly protein TadD
MRIRALAAAALVLALTAPVLADKRSDAKEHVEFGIELAKKGLWSSAIRQWERAKTIDPDYLAAWNNLAIAYEQMGKFHEAREAYDEALKLDPNNSFLRTNYEQFREIYDRQNRRRDR